MGSRGLWVLLFLLVMTTSNILWADVALRTLTLQEALQLGEVNHPTLAGGLASIEIEHGLETQTRSAEFPQITMLNDFERANSRGSVFGASQAFTTYSSELELNQLITDFGKTWDKVEASHQLVIQAQETLLSDIQQVRFNVYDDYYLLLEAKANIRVQQQSVKDLQEHLNQAQAFFQVGTQPAIDVVQAESNLSAGKLSLIQAENTYAISQTNLKAAMGAPEFPPFQVQEELTAPPYDISLDTAVQQAYHDRPDLFALLAQQKSDQASLSAAEKGYFPTLNGSATRGWIGPTFVPQANAWTLGVSFDIPIFNGLLTEGQIQQAKGNLDLANSQVNNLRLTIRQGVEQAYDNFVSAKTSLQVAQDALKYAKESFDLADGRYKTGIGNYIEFSDAELAYTQAQVNWIQALGNYNIDIAALEQAMGILKGAVVTR